MKSVDRAICWFQGHQWFEHWMGTRMDHCLRCDFEKAHETVGCRCTVCNFPGGLEGWLEWCRSFQFKV